MKEKFVGRYNELKALEEKYKVDGFKMAVIYGRRRVGKTAILNKFIEDKAVPVISYIAVEQGEKEQLEMLSSEVLSAIAPALSGRISFDSFGNVFDFLTEAAAKQRVILIIDEYPYLARECKYMNSLLQKYIDHDWKNTNLFLVLCGSLVSFMSEKVIGKNAPLYGRSDLEMKIKPFGYLDAGEFVPDYSYEDKAVVYGITGGMAAYLKQFNPDKNLDTNIAEQFFVSTGYFSTELIRTVISGDRLNPSAYNNILSAIAGGHTKYNEIASATGIDNLKYYLDVLIEAELVEKRTAKRPYYIISDSMLRFWFGYVNKASSLINADNGERYYYNSVKKELHSFMGTVFEDMCKDFIFRNALTDVIPVTVTDVSEYQDNIKTDDGIKQIEIDILGRNGNRNVLAGECKFKNESFDKAELERFRDKLNCISGTNLIVMLFSLNGFTDYVKKNAGNAILINIKRMYER